MTFPRVPWNKLPPEEAARRKKEAQHKAEKRRRADPVLKAAMDERAGRWSKQNRVANWPTYIIVQLRHRAKKKGIECTVTAKDIVVPAVCPVLGIPLRTGAPKNSPECPSVDRIDNAKGYIPGNVYVISYRANRLKGDATLDELRALVRYVEAHQ